LRNVILMVGVLAAPSCLGAEPEWLAMFPGTGCVPLSALYEVFPYLQGNATPGALRDAMNQKYHDASLQPFLDFRAEALKGANEQENAQDRAFFSQFSQTNALVLAGNSGRVAIPLLTRDLCQRAGMLPPEPGAWLSQPAPAAGTLQGGTEIAQASIHEVSAHMVRNVAMNLLGKRAWAALPEDAARLYAGPQYAAEQGKRPYLVRGLKGAAASRVVARDGVLYVIYAAGAGPRLGPLVVNLAAEPKSVQVVPESALAVQEGGRQ